MSDPMETTPGGPAPRRPDDRSGSRTRTREEIEGWLVTYLASLLGLPKEKIDRDTRFDEYGLDSIAAVAITAELSEWLGRKLDIADANGEVTVASVARLAMPADPRATPDGESQIR